MRACVLAAILAAVVVGERPVFAQAPGASRVFVEAAMMTERDPTEFFYGTDTGAAGRVAVGLHWSEANSVRFEVDVPRWRVRDNVYAGPVWCAGPTCVNGEGFVPARTTSHAEVRTVSCSVLYARHLPAIGRMRLALIGGASAETRRFRASDSIDQLGPDGSVLAHNASDRDNTKYWPGIVAGVDAEISVASHVVVVPQFRFHTFPYPSVSIVRTGVALRWQF